MLCNECIERFHVTRSVSSRTLASENVLRYNFVCSVTEIHVKSELEARLYTIYIQLISISIKLKTMQNIASVVD